MIENYVNKTINCACGKTHRSQVEKVVISSTAIEVELVDFIKQNGYDKITVICDQKSYAVAGEKVLSVLERVGAEYKVHKFNDDLVPDERAVGNILMGAMAGSKAFLSVGSGTLNDLTRYASAVKGLPYFVVGTAPSMDGYISAGSALIYNGLKLTFETHAPQAVFFVPEILANAPRDMIASGVGDLLGKINCLKDWKLSAIINDEYLCPFIYDTTFTAVENTVTAKDGIINSDDNAVATLLESLLISGVCMDYAGNSRPASGCEHHISHFWEMRYIMENRPAVFHGTKVGIGTIIALKAYEYIARLKPDFNKIRKAKRKTYDEWESEVKTAFMGASDEIIALEKAKGKNDERKINNRLTIIEKKWSEITALAMSGRKSDEVKDFLLGLSAPIYPHQIGVDKEMAKQAILYAKEIRDRYTVLQLLCDLNELEKFATLIIDEYYD